MAVAGRAPATLDLDTGRFDRACRTLADAVREFEPDVVVGIATGGAEVARSLAPHLPGPPEVVEVELRRPSTGLKKRMRLDKLLGRLPRRANNLLRRLEVGLREKAVRPAGDHADPPSLDPGFQATLQDATRTLVVDDTVDSGRTLSTAVELTRTAAPEAELRTAVLASTFKDPPVRADYCLYDRTLLRLPWSLDV